ncbi:MAG: GDP-mannose 4,6-dehydratase [Proteobacteria bacterium]|nr:GDP-mannose 4,6-dehydratase [Pseudomonadota bacterium]
MKSALITGITGQDGSYLAELLLSKGYMVHGIIRRASTFNTDRLDHLYTDLHEKPQLRLHFGDMTDPNSLSQIIETTQPDEVYNLAAQSHVRVSFDIPQYTAQADGIGTLNLLEALREHMVRSKRTVRMYQAGTSEMFGATPPPQSESSPFYPRSPYGVAKVFAHWSCVNYREAYNMFVANGILFNHESPRRGETFVTRKVTRAATRIKHGLQDKLYLGNLESVRDWGFAGDFVEAMWLMLQQEKPDDYVVATGQAHSVRDLLDETFALLDLDWKKYVEIDPRYFRPTEVDNLQGSAEKAQRALGWKPKTSFKDLVKMMVAHDLDLAAQEAHLKKGGFAASHRGRASN